MFQSVLVDQFVINKTVLNGDFRGRIGSYATANMTCFHNGAVDTAFLEHITAKKTGDPAAYDQYIGF